jgi:hypothetical protein
MLQILTLKLDGITAGDYLAWCRESDPPALGFVLRSVHVDADPLGDTITAARDWNEPPPPPPAAAAAAGLPLLPAARIHRLTTGGAAAIDRPSVQERVGVVDLERRPASSPPGHQKLTRERPHEGPAGERSRRHLRHMSEGVRAGQPGPPHGQPIGSPLKSPERSQVEHELTHLLTDLGGATFALAHHGALTDERLASRVRQIHELFTQLNALDHSTRTSQQDDEPATALAA